MESHRVVERLFFKCCRHVLASPSLADLVPHLLPKPIAQYLLLIACDINNLIVVTKLIKSWKFSDISLCHTANALWCRDVAEGYRWLAHDITQFHLPETIVRIHQTSISCVSPSEYHGVFSARDLSDQCVSAIAVGLYEYVTYNMRVAGTVPTLAVDLSGVIIDDASPICACCSGSYPVTSPADYISQGDKKAFYKVTSQHPPLPTITTPSPPVKILSHLYIKGHGTVDMLARATKASSPIQLVVKGISTHCPRQLIRSRCFDLSLVTNIELAVNDSDGVDIFQHLTTAGLCGIGCSVSVSLTLGDNDLLVQEAAKWLEGLGVVNNLCVKGASSPRKSDLRYLVTYANSQNLKVLALHALTDQCIETILSIIPLNRLEYLNVSFITINHLQLCQHLRTLSLSGKVTLPTSPLIYCVGQLPMLEYFVLKNKVNIRTNDLLALYSVLTSSLPHLSHWHMNTGILLLEDTDPHNEKYAALSDLLHGFVQGWTGTDACNTLSFRIDPDGRIHRWLTSLRPGVCFRLKLY